MEKTDEYIAKRLKWKAEQHRFPTQNSLFFENLTSDKKEHYSKLLKGLDFGIPVLIFTQPNNDNWTIIGTRKIFWGKDNESESLLLENIKEIKPHSFNEPKDAQNAIENSFVKSEWNELTLKDLNNTVCNVYANKGSDFFAMWSILRMVWQMNLT